MQINLNDKVKYLATRDKKSALHPDTLRVEQLGTTFAFCVRANENTNQHAGEWLKIDRLVKI